MLFLSSSFDNFMFKWDLGRSAVCKRSQRHIHHEPYSQPTSTDKRCGGLQSFHEAEDDVPNWLETTATIALTN